MSFVAGIATSARLDDTDAKDVQKELKRLEGTWVVTSLTVQGMEVDKANYGESVLVIKASEATTLINDENRGEFTIVIDPKAMPSTINMVVKHGPGEGTEIRGIYKLEKDTLTICVTHDPEGRPKEFASREGSRDVLVVHKKKP